MSSFGIEVQHERLPQQVARIDLPSFIIAYRYLRQPVTFCKHSFPLSGLRVERRIRDGTCPACLISLLPEARFGFANVEIAVQMSADAHFPHTRVLTRSRCASSHIIAPVTTCLLPERAAAVALACWQPRV